MTTEPFRGFDSRFQNATISFGSAIVHRMSNDDDQYIADIDRWARSALLVVLAWIALAAMM